MTYAELREMILDESHRADLVARVPSFVDRAEAMISRRLRAVEMLALTTLAEADRTEPESPIYNLPALFLEDRALTCASVPLRKVGRDALMMTTSSGPVMVYYLRGAADNSQVEFRATPGVDATIDMEYFARPVALTEDTDTNRLLAAHETVYLHAALFALYSWTQDLELAKHAYDTWLGSCETLNEQAGRYLGGTGLRPGHNLGHFSIGRGY